MLDANPENYRTLLSECWKRFLTFCIDVRDVWRQGTYSLAGHLQDFDFGMFLRREIGHDLYDPYFLVSFICSFNYLFVTLGLFCFAFIPNHRNVLRTSLVVAGLRYLLFLLLLCFVLFFFLDCFSFLWLLFSSGSRQTWKPGKWGIFEKKSGKNFFVGKVREKSRKNFFLFVICFHFWWRILKLLKLIFTMLLFFFLFLID